MDLEEQYEKIYRYCYFRLGHRETAEDVTQETFLRFWEREGYQERGCAIRYLYGIARNLCIDEYRRKKPEALPEELAAAGGEERLLEGIVLREVLKKLPEEERELLLLRYANEEKISVIGGILGLSRFAVARRLRRAEKRLEELLRKEEMG